MAGVTSPLCKKPTILKLENMKGLDGKPLRIFRNIAVRHGELYPEFGASLLNDPDHVDVDLIKMNHKFDGHEVVVKAFAREWLMKGGPTCTYQHLIDCVREYGMKDLADQIRDTILKEGSSETSSKHVATDGDKSENAGLWDQKCSNDHLIHISTLIAQWRDVAPFLGLTPADEQDIIGDAPQSIQRQRIGMLYKWSEKEGDNATYRKLAERFKQCRRQDIVDEIKILVTGGTGAQWSIMEGIVPTVGQAVQGSNTATPGPTPAVSSTSASAGTASLIQGASVGPSGSHTVATDDGGPAEDELCKRSALGSGFNRSNLETPDPASYWSLNEICKYGGNGTTLLMFDTGITRESHPSFPLVKVEALDDLDGHGTCCAGIACGSLHVYNVDGVLVKCRGVAPNANLVTWKAYDYAKEIPFKPWLEALEAMASYCARDDVHVDVVVISSGFEQNDKRMKDAIKKLDNQGVIVVCAAGNDGAKNIHNIKYPARYPQTISVGAHDRDGHPCGFSSVGEKIDVFALGEDITGPNRVDTMLEDSNIRKYLRQEEKGTSFAAPAVGALICLILQAVKDTPACNDHYDQIKDVDSMKLLLQKLATPKRVICPEQLKKFFDKAALGPSYFIKDMIASNEI